MDIEALTIHIGRGMWHMCQARFYMDPAFTSPLRFSISPPQIQYLSPSDSVSTVCGEGQFECYTNQRCINTTQMCDGANDCGDGSDEGKFLCRGELLYYAPPPLIAPLC